MDENTGTTGGKAKKAFGLLTGTALLSGKGSRIGNGVAVLLLLAAGIADLLTLIPFVGIVVGPVFWFGVAVFLWTKGCGFINTGRLTTEAISTIAEMVPAIQELPTIIVGMLIVIVLIRLEDRTGVSVIKPLSQGKMPLNIEGVRQPQIAGVPSLSRNPNTQPLNTYGVRQPTPIQASSAPQESKSGWKHDEAAGKFTNDSIKSPADKPDWTRDKEPSRYVKELNERVEAAKSLGYSQEQAEKMGFEVQQREEARRSKIQKGEKLPNAWDRV